MSERLTERAAECDACEGLEESEAREGMFVLGKENTVYEL